MSDRCRLVDGACVGSSVIPGRSSTPATWRTGFTLRFLGGFARYELGELDPAIRRDLERNATPRFAGALLATPPAVPTGAAAPAPGRLVDLDFVPGEIDAGQLQRTEFVATVSRAGRRDQVAVSLRRATAGGWVVDGLGR